MDLATLIVQLVQYHCEGREPEFRTTAAFLAKRAKNPRIGQMIHDALAKRPQGQAPEARRSKNAQPVPGPSKWLTQLEHMDIAALKLPTAVEDLVAELVTEDTAASALEERGLDPRRRVLLHGPPGNGKTSLARALGGALGIPALALSSDIVSSHMGETSARLTALADAFGEARFMLVIDEIDSLGVSRGSETTDCSREDARTLTALLMLLDRKLSNWIVATTNRLDRVDVALIRRFDEIIEMPAPSAEQLTELAESLASQYQVRTPDVSRCANFDAVTKTVRTSARRQIVREHVGRAEQ